MEGCLWLLIKIFRCYFENSLIIWMTKHYRGRMVYKCLLIIWKKQASIVLCIVLIFVVSTSAAASPREWSKFPVAKKGDKTHRTTLVQRILYELPGYFTDISEIDSSFGGRTDTQVKSYQRNHSLDPDGSVGPITWTSLETKLRFYDTDHTPVPNPLKS